MGNSRKKTNEVGFLLYFPILVLSLLCVVFGVFFNFTARRFITASVGDFSFAGMWQPVVSTNFIIIGIILGIIIFNISKKKIRVTGTYLGGEILDSNLKSEDFYSDIKELPLLKWAYLKAEARFFDLYEQGKNLVFSITAALRYLHNGVLPTYLAWCILGIMGLLAVFIK
jgi:hypothetical protein